jgi:hypothetical protein
VDGVLGIFITSNLPRTAWFRNVWYTQLQALKARLPQIEVRTRALQGDGYEALKASVLQKLGKLGFVGSTECGAPSNQFDADV